MIGKLAMKKVTILLADNDPDFLKARQKILQAEGYEVVLASKPEDAVQILQNDDIALAVVDLRLEDDEDDADMSGLALIRRVAPKIPKILLTGHPTIEVTRRALKGYYDQAPAAVDMLSKSDDPENFLRAVSQALEKHVTHRQRRALWLKISVAILILMVIISFFLVVVLNRGIQEVFITILSALALEIVAALVVRFTLEK